MKLYNILRSVLCRRGRLREKFPQADSEPMKLILSFTHLPDENAVENYWL
jgi:hypothetical protein